MVSQGYIDYRNAVNAAGGSMSPQATNKLDQIFAQYLPQLRHAGVLPLLNADPDSVDRRRNPWEFIAAGGFQPYAGLNPGIEFDRPPIDPWNIANRDFNKEWTTDSFNRGFSKQGYLPPKAGEVGPGEMINIVPPQPVTAKDWFDRGRELFEGVGALAEKFTNPMSHWDSVQRTKDAVRDAEAGVPPVKEDEGFLKNLASKGLNTFSNYFKEELEGLEAVEETVMPATGYLSRKGGFDLRDIPGLGRLPESINIPGTDHEIPWSVARFEPYAENARGAELRYQALRDAGYGPFESSSAAILEAERAGEIPWHQQLVSRAATDPFEALPGGLAVGAAKNLIRGGNIVSRTGRELSRQATRYADAVEAGRAARLRDPFTYPTPAEPMGSNQYWDGSRFTTPSGAEPFGSNQYWTPPTPPEVSPSRFVRPEVTPPMQEGTGFTRYADEVPSRFTSPEMIGPMEEGAGFTRSGVDVPIDTPRTNMAWRGDDVPEGRSPRWLTDVSGMAEGTLRANRFWNSSDNTPNTLDELRSKQEIGTEIDDVSRVGQSDKAIRIQEISAKSVDEITDDDVSFWLKEGLVVSEQAHPGMWQRMVAAKKLPDVDLDNRIFSDVGDSYPPASQFAEDEVGRKFNRYWSPGMRKIQEVASDDAVREAFNKNAPPPPKPSTAKPKILGKKESRARTMERSDYERGKDELAKTLVEQFAEGAAPAYIRWMIRMHDSTYAMRNLIDNYFRYLHPHAAFKHGSDIDVVAASNLTGGELPRAQIRYKNFMDTKILPLLGNGVEQWQISRILQARHWRTVADNHPNRTALPVPIDPKTGEVVADVFDQDGVIRQMAEWEPGIRSSLSDEQWARVESGVKAVADEYSHERQRMVKSGVLTQKQADELAQSYPWYNPTSYVEFAEITGKGLHKSSSPYTNPSSGIMSLSDDLDVVLGAMDPLDPDVMLRQFAQNEMRIKRNTVAKSVHALMGDDGWGWLKDVSKQFEGQRVPFDPQAKSGYLSFYENGQRKVFGAAGTGTNPIQPELYKFIYGKGGLASRSDSELWHWASFFGGMVRGAITTYNPLFMVGNALIDMFTVWLKRGIAPPSVIRQLVKNYGAMVNDADNNFIELMRASGMMQSRTTNISTYSKNIEYRLRSEGLHGEVLSVDDARNIDSATRVNRWLEDIFEKNFISRGLKGTGSKWSKTSQVLEQMSRLEVAERTIIKRLGKEEWTRLKNLSPDEFRKELLDNYRGTPGIGLADHPAIREAGLASLEATLNFWRGGEWIRKINPITYFLNASMEGSKLPLRALGINLHPQIIPVKNPGDGVRWEFGNYKDIVKEGYHNGGDLGVGKALRRAQERGVTGSYEDLDISERTTSRLRFERGEDGVLPRVEEQAEDLSSLFSEGRNPNPLARHIETAFTGKGQGGANGALLRMSGVAAAQATVMGWNLMHADEWGYWDIPGWIKYSGFLILLPPRKDDDGNVEIDPNTGRVKPNFMVLPHRTREWSIVTGGVQFLLEELYGLMDDTPEGKNDKRIFAKNLFGNMTPVDNLPVFGALTGGGHPVTRLAEPFVGLRQLSEELTGRDFWKDEPIVPYDLKYEDTDYQFDRSTSPTVRKLAGILPENNTYSSPMRLDHLIKNVGGGFGQAALMFPDWVIGGVEDLHRREKMSDMTTPEAQVEHYRNLKSRPERTAFKASIQRLGPDAFENFDRELRMPRRHFEQLPFIKEIIDKYNPPYSGGQREIAELRREDILADSGIDIPSADAQARMKADINKVKKIQYTKQQEDDAELQIWAHRPAGDTTSGTAPSEWRRRRGERFSSYDFFRETLVELYGEKSVYAMTEEDQTTYYNAIFEISSKGGEGDTRSMIDLLWAGYHAIKYPEDEDADFDQLNAFYNARRRYRENMQAYFGDDIFNEFEGMRMSYMTQGEVQYDRAREVMAPYWDIGNTAESIIPNASPQQKQRWETYLRASDIEKQQMRREPDISTFLKHRDFLRRRYVLSTLDQNGESNLDYLLTFWYGDSAYKGKAVTHSARIFGERMYGAYQRRSSPYVPSLRSASETPQLLPVN